MRRHRRDYEILSDMNLTNLLDTAFVLLITFIIAAPSIRTGLDVQLPHVEAATNLPPSDSPIQIDIKKKSNVEGAEDQIILDDRRVDIPTLQGELEKKKGMATATKKKLQVVINADRDASVNALYQVISVLKALQIEDVGLPTEPMEGAASGDKTKEKKPS